jgi:hypothetical protein
MAEIQSSPKSSVEIIVYLASLASEQQAVSAMLDPMRRITAALKPGQAPLPEQEKVLQNVRRNIEHYLVVDEPLKQLTPELLEDKIAGFSEGRAGFRVPWAILGLVAFSILTGIAMALAPFQVADTVRPGLVIVGVLSAVGLGASWMFFLALPGVKPQLRPALLLMSIGIAYNVLAQLQVPFLTVTNQLDSAWSSYGIYVVFYCPLAIFFFLALRKFAFALGVSSGWRDVRWVASVCVLGTLVVLLMPHADSTIPEWALRLTIFTSAVQVSFQLLTAQITWRIIDRLTSAYATTMKYFFWSAIGTAVSSVVYIAAQITTGAMLDQSSQHVVLLAVMTVPFLVSEFLLAWAGYSFRRASRR